MLSEIGKLQGSEKKSEIGSEIGSEENLKVYSFRGQNYRLAPVGCFIFQHGAMYTKALKKVLPRKLGHLPVYVAVIYRPQLEDKLFVSKFLFQVFLFALFLFIYQLLIVWWCAYDTTFRINYDTTPRNFGVG